MKVSPWRGKKKNRERTTRGTWTPDILWPKHQKVYHPHGQATSTWYMFFSRTGSGRWKVKKKTNIFGRGKQWVCDVFFLKQLLVCSYILVTTVASY